MTADRIARLIGAGSGLVHVLVNAGALGSPLDVVLRVGAVLPVATLLGVLLRGGPGPAGERPPVFGRGCALVVLAEVAAVVGRPLRPPGAHPLTRCRKAVFTPPRCGKVAFLQPGAPRPRRPTGAGPGPRRAPRP